MYIIFAISYYRIIIVVNNAANSIFTVVALPSYLLTIFRHLYIIFTSITYKIIIHYYRNYRLTHNAHQQ